MQKIKIKKSAPKFPLIYQWENFEALWDSLQKTDREKTVGFVTIEDMRFFGLMIFGEARRLRKNRKLK